MKKGSDYLLELQLNRREKVLFLLVAEKRMKEKKLTKKQLAEKINRPYGTVRNYFYDLSTINKFLTAEIATALDIKESDWNK